MGRSPSPEQKSDWKAVLKTEQPSLSMAIASDFLSMSADQRQQQAELARKKSASMRTAALMIANSTAADEGM
jgi:hypothetical protein